MPDGSDRPIAIEHESDTEHEWVVYWNGFWTRTFHDKDEAVAWATGKHAIARTDKLTVQHIVTHTSVTKYEPVEIAHA